MHAIAIRQLGRTDYAATLAAMQRHTAARTPDTQDELWVTEHDPVYTLGLNRKDVRPPSRDDIPLVLVDRGGKITYHGPGQIVVYLLLDLKRRGINVRQLVSCMENAMVMLLADFDITALARADAPGVYVQDCKIASLGLRLKQQCCYHGLALNVAMDLSPFDAIDPCGYQGLQVTQLQALGITMSQQEVAAKLIHYLTQLLNSAPLQLAA